MTEPTAEQAWTRLNVLPAVQQDAMLRSLLDRAGQGDTCWMGLHRDRIAQLEARSLRLTRVQIAYDNLHDGRVIEQQDLIRFAREVAEALHAVCCPCQTLNFLEDD